MDLAVDESGLWVLSGYSGYSGRLAATMIDPVTLYTRHAWNVGGEAQNSMGEKSNTLTEPVEGGRHSCNLKQRGYASLFNCIAKVLNDS